MKSLLLTSSFCLLATILPAQSNYPYERYRFTTFAGAPPGNVDGSGSAARFNSPSHAAVDGTGNVFVADTKNSTIRKITPDGVVSTFAGSPGNTGSSDGQGAAARFNWPEGVAIDSADNVYVSDYFNHTIRKISPAGVVTTLAGAPGLAGTADGIGSAARFSSPLGLAVDRNGTVYVADRRFPSDGAVRKISPGGDVTTLVSGVKAVDVAVDDSGNAFVAELETNKIDKITPSGGLSTFAGSGTPGSADGTGTSAQFSGVNGICIDSSGNLYVADSANETIRKITPDRVVTTLAGSPGSVGTTNGSTSAAKFNFPTGVTVTADGVLYVSDLQNNEIRKIALGAVTTFAGLASQGDADGPRTSAQFFQPGDVAWDTGGNIYVADTANHTVRKIDRNGLVTTLAGLSGNPGSADGFGQNARFNRPSGLTVDKAGNLYVADTSNCTIRKIRPDGFVSTIAGQAGVCGTADGTGFGARFGLPADVAVDSVGNLYVADSYNHTIRRISSSGIVTTFAGTADPGSPGSLADGNGAAATFSYVYGIAIDADGVLYVADSGNGAIRKITPDRNVSTFARLRNYKLALDGSGNIYVADSYDNSIHKINPAGGITTLAGWGAPGSAEGTGSAALFNAPGGIAVDQQGNVFVADAGNNAIRVGGPEAIGQSLNISTRTAVQTGSNVMIGGFIVTGHRPKKVIVRAIGPSLARNAISDSLADPELELHDATGAAIAANHDWKIADDGNSANVAEIAASGIAPSDDRESAIIATLQPNQNYTAIVRGEKSATGVAVVEVYDLNPTADALLANISTRGFVGSNNEVMIGGFILGGGNGAAKVVLRAIGPSLGAAGIENTLQDPTLELHDANGNGFAANDNWKDAQQSEIEATGLAPANEFESTLLLALPPGNYTAVVAGKNGDTGVGLMEIYNLE